MNLKEIKFSYKTRRREAKASYKAELERIRRDRLEQTETFRLENGIEAPKDPPARPLLEEIGNSVTHGTGALLSAVFFALMLAFSSSAVEYIGAAVYFFGSFVMYTVSCLYHAFRRGSAVKRLFRRFDYSCIYLLIGATFAPILLGHVGGTLGAVFFAVQWSVIALGITLVAVFGPTRLRKLHIPLYLILGWSGLMLIPSLISAGIGFALWILAGGVVYSLGVIPFALKRGPSHFIWHFFVLAGWIVQWVGIFVYIYLK